jgi:hypothetical protein
LREEHGAFIRRFPQIKTIRKAGNQERDAINSAGPAAVLGSFAIIAVKILFVPLILFKTFMSLLLSVFASVTTTVSL